MSKLHHPLWAIVRVVAVFMAAVVAMKFTATNFDGTEIKAILAIVLTHSGLEAATAARNN